SARHVRSPAIDHARGDAAIGGCMRRQYVPRRQAPWYQPKHALSSPFSERRGSLKNLNHCFRRNWWSRGESNPWPRHCERRALPTELLPHIRIGGRGLSLSRQGVSRDCGDGLVGCLAFDEGALLLEEADQGIHDRPDAGQSPQVAMDEKPLIG